MVRVEFKNLKKTICYKKTEYGCEASHPMHTVVELKV
jgi:hypothetical protein